MNKDISNSLYDFYELEKYICKNISKSKRTDKIEKLLQNIELDLKIISILREHLTVEDILNPSGDDIYTIDEATMIF